MLEFLFLPLLCDFQADWSHKILSVVVVDMLQFSSTMFSKNDTNMYYFLTLGILFFQVVEAHIPSYIFDQFRIHLT